MSQDRIFKTKLLIGISSVIIFISGIAVKMLLPKEVIPVISDINSLMTLAGVVFGGLVRDVLGFSLPSVTPDTTKSTGEMK